MSTDTFQCLLEKVAPKISKLNTSFRESISAGERLALTLRYLATGTVLQKTSVFFLNITYYVIENYFYYFNK